MSAKVRAAGARCSPFLNQPKSTSRACYIQYPVLKAFPTSPEDIIMGEKVPPKEAQDEFLASRVPGTIIRSATPPARGLVSAMLHAYGSWGEFVGRDRHLMPDTGIEEA